MTSNEYGHEQMGQGTIRTKSGSDLAENKPKLNLLAKVPNAHKLRQNEASRKRIRELFAELERLRGTA